jgi:hypothetical protein
MRGILASTSTIAGIVAWLQGASRVWLAGAALIFAVVPFTMFAIMPTNRKLLNLQTRPDVGWGETALGTLGLYMLSRILCHANVRTMEDYLKSLNVLDQRQVHDEFSPISGGKEGDARPHSPK